MAQTYDFVVTDMALTQAQLKQANRWIHPSQCAGQACTVHLLLYCLQ